MFVDMAAEHFKAFEAFQENTGNFRHQYIEMSSVKEESEYQIGKCEQRNPDTVQIA